MAAAANRMEPAANRYFHQLENITPYAVAELFKGPEFEEKPHKKPIFIFLIGSPGAGKTTIAKKKINELEGKGFYEKMYNVSLDTVVENIEPFRRYTYETYKALENAREVTQENIDELSHYYLHAVQSKKSNLLLPYLNSKRREKLGLPPGNYPLGYSVPDSVQRKKETKVAASLSAMSLTDSPMTKSQMTKSQMTKSQMTKSQMTKSPMAESQMTESPNRNNQTKKKSPVTKAAAAAVNQYPPIKTQTRKNGKPGDQYWCEHCSQWFMTKKTVENHYAKYGFTEQKGGSVISVIDEAIQLGIENSYHILYDTTLELSDDYDKNTKELIGQKVNKVVKILKFLPRQYEIRMYLVETKESLIKKRIVKRHEQMIRQGFLRAISSRMIHSWIKENREAFEFSRKHYSPPITKFGVFYNDDAMNERYESPVRSLSVWRKPSVKRSTSAPSVKRSVERPSERSSSAQRPSSAKRSSRNRSPPGTPTKTRKVNKRANTP